MRIINLPHGKYPVVDDATHLYGVSIQALVDHFLATVDYESFAVGQNVLWKARRAEVTIYKKHETLLNYWEVVTKGGVMRVVHESELVEKPGPVAEKVK